MKKRIFLLIATMVTALFIITGCGDQSDRTNPEFGSITNSGMIQMMDTMEYDWKDINIAGGYAVHEFPMKNTGDADLYLKGATTSCMCTTAEILLPDGSVSPKFGMHNNRMDWVYAVHPEEEFTVRATFDPMAHGPKGTGPISRSVVLITSSESNEIAKENFQEKRGNVTGFMLKGNVLSKEDFESMHEAMEEVMDDMMGEDFEGEDMYDRMKGMIGSDDFENIDEIMDEMMGAHDDNEYADLPEYEISNRDVLGKVLQENGTIVVDVREDSELAETGVIKGAVHIPLGELSMNALTEKGISKDSEIILYCRSGNRSRQAYELLNTLGYTNVKSMNGGIIHWIEDKLPVIKWSGNDLSAMADQKKNSNVDGAKIVFDRLSEDLGMVSPTNVTKTMFIVKNEGTQTLEIGTITTSCACTNAEISNKSIKPGDTAELVVTFDPTVHEEPKDKFKRTVFLETNDPSMPEAEVHISVDIDESKK